MNAMADQNLALGTDIESSHSLKSSLDPSTTNVVETPEPQPEEYSDDFEVDPASPDTIDPELINTPGLNPEDDDGEGQVAPESVPEIQEQPDADPEPDEVIREEIESGVRDRNSISNPDAGI